MLIQRYACLFFSDTNFEMHHGIYGPDLQQTFVTSLVNVLQFTELSTNGII